MASLLGPAFFQKVVANVQTASTIRERVSKSPPKVGQVWKWIPEHVRKTMFIYDAFQNYVMTAVWNCQVICL